LTRSNFQPYAATVGAPFIPDVVNASRLNREAFLFDGAEL
jgi:hypothetical protein